MTFFINFMTLLSNCNLFHKIIPRYLHFSTLSTISPFIVIGETAGGCFLKSISNSFVSVTLRSKKLSLHYDVFFQLPLYNAGWSLTNLQSLCRQSIL